MKRLIAIFCCCVMLSVPAMAGRVGDDPLTNGNPTMHDDFDIEYCKTHQDECRGGTKTHARKHSDTTKIIVISVAAGAVFAGAMWYIFKKAPSENNPGQVKLASF